MQNIKKGVIVRNSYGHEGALYKGDIVMIKEFTSKKLRVTDLSGKLYWLKPEFIKITNWYITLY